MPERESRETQHISKARKAFADTLAKQIKVVDAQCDETAVMHVDQSKKGMHADIYVDGIHVRKIEAMKSSAWQYDICVYAYNDHVN